MQRSLQAGTKIGVSQTRKCFQQYTHGKDIQQQYFQQYTRGKDIQQQCFQQYTHVKDIQQQ